MKICYVASDLTYKGGIQNLSSNLIAHMSRQCEIEQMLVVCDEISEMVLKNVETNKTTIRCIGRPKKGDLPRIALRNVNFNKLSKEMKTYNVIHVLDDRALPIVSLSNHQVVTVHDIMLQELYTQIKSVGSGGIGNLPRFIDHYGPQLPLEYMAIIRSNKIIINSPIVGERLRKLYGSLLGDKLAIIPPGFDPQRFNPHFISQREARERLGLDSSAKIIMVVGGDKTSSRRKGLPYVLHALDHLYKSGVLENQNIRLLLVGGFPEKWMQEFPHLARYIMHRPYVPDDLMAIAYRAADLFVMPSTSEGWGIALIEALACGTSVISSINVPSAFATKSTGVVYIEQDVNNATALANSMLRELSNKRQSMEWPAIYDFLVENFSWQNLCKSLLTVYKQAANMET